MDTPRCRLSRLLRTTWLAGVAVMLVSIPAWSQETVPPAEPEPEEELTAPAQVVGVDDRVDDEDIVRRLTDILVATQRFTDPDVRVENGVVFLKGTTSRQEYKDWARQLALKTEDVVAVVNDIEVVEPKTPLWDFSPSIAVVNDMWRKFARSLPVILLAALILLLTFVAARLISRAFTPLLRRRFESAILQDVTKKLIWLGVVVIGIYFVLRVSGLTNLAVTILGGTGLVGLVVGFAFRDIAENFLASLLISVQRPFRIGDTIEVEGHVGIVQKVTIRGTVLMAFDGNHIQITNANVYKSTIRNFTANPKMRLDFKLGVGYDTSITEAQTIVMTVLREHPAVLKDPPPMVLVDQLAASTVELQVYFWINCHEHSNIKVKSAVLRLTFAALSEAGVPMPDAEREVVFPKGVPVYSIDKSEREEVTQQARQEQRNIGTKERLPEERPAEEDLSSEVDDLKAQADASQLPEEGPDLLS